MKLFNLVSCRNALCDVEAFQEVTIDTDRPLREAFGVYPNDITPVPGESLQRLI
jgi:hypothetical protein